MNLLRFLAPDRSAHAHCDIPCGVYDPEQARILLKKAQKIHGGKLPELKIAMAWTSTFYRQFGQFLERQMREVGLEVEIQYMDWPTFIEKVNSRSAQMFTFGGVASIPDAEDFLGSFSNNLISC